MTQATVSYAPSDRLPYVLVIYPSVRNEADERLLDEVAPKAAELGPAGAGVSPKSPGLTNTVALWRRGSLATFAGSYVSAAKAARLLAVVKLDGGPTEIVLSRFGSEVQIIQIR
jgi:hypothetical protein